MVLKLNFSENFVKISYIFFLNYGEKTIALLCSTCLYFALIYLSRNPEI